jgi:hypothetical protein
MKQLKGSVRWDEVSVVSGAIADPLQTGNTSIFMGFWVC